MDYDYIKELYEKLSQTLSMYLIHYQNEGWISFTDKKDEIDKQKNITTNFKDMVELSEFLTREIKRQVEEWVVNNPPRFKGKTFDEIIDENESYLN